MSRTCLILAMLCLFCLSVQAQEGEPSYEANFGRDWQAGHDRENHLIWQPTRQGLALSNVSPDAPARYANASHYQATDFYLEMNFILSACASEQSALLLNVRSDPAELDPLNARAYVFVLQCDGSYRARAVNENGAAEEVDFEGRLNLPLNPKIPQTLGIFLQGQEAALYWEGRLLGEFEIEQEPQKGQFALGAQLGLDILITDLRVWDLAKSTK